MVLNVNRIKARINRAINTAPTEAVYRRRVYESDGRGGQKHIGDKDVGKFQGILDNTSSSAIQLIFNDGGKSRDDTAPKLYVIYDEVFSPEVNDYFRIDNIEYRFANCVNILELDILWEVTLSFNEVKVNGEQ